jgi:hypothetical protein
VPSIGLIDRPATGCWWSSAPPALVAGAALECDSAAPRGLFPRTAPAPVRGLRNPVDPALEYVHACCLLAFVHGCRARRTLGVSAPCRSTKSNSSIASSSEMPRSEPNLLMFAAIASRLNWSRLRMHHSLDMRTGQIKLYPACCRSKANVLHSEEVQRSMNIFVQCTRNLRGVCAASRCRGQSGEHDVLPPSSPSWNGSAPQQRHVCISASILHSGVRWIVLSARSRRGDCSFPSSPAVATPRLW